MQKTFQKPKTENKKCADAYLKTFKKLFQFLHTGKCNKYHYNTLT